MKGVGLAVSCVLMPNERRFAFAGNNAARLFPECFPIVLGSLFCPVVFCCRVFSRRLRLRPIFSAFRLFPTDWCFPVIHALFSKLFRMSKTPVLPDSQPPEYPQDEASDVGGQRQPATGLPPPAAGRGEDDTA